MNGLDFLVKLAGKWQGVNKLWLPPAETPYESTSIATLTPVIKGKFVRLDYTWVFEDEPQEGCVDDVTPELSSAILPECRSHGLGTRLMTHLFNAVRDRYPAISLSVSPDNPAQRLYQRFGFEVIGTSGTSLTMVKRWHSD